MNPEDRIAWLEGMLKGVQEELTAVKASLAKPAELEVTPDMIGKLGELWDDDRSSSVYGLLVGMDPCRNSDMPYQEETGAWWMHFEPIRSDDPRIYRPKKTRYDWSKAPKEARYWTTDRNGRQDQWLNKPVANLDGGVWQGGLTIRTAIWARADCPDWADSLEERPDGV